MTKLEQEAKKWMKERKMMSSITATEYQIRAAETAIFPKEKALEYITLGLTAVSYTHLTLPTIYSV